MKWIQRDLQKKFLSLNTKYSGLLIIGPRQVGKTSFLQKNMDQNRNYVTLDDMNERKLAQSDPELFLQIHSAPVLIDEIQYAPQLFSQIKIEIDKGAKPSSFWMTGSQSFQLMKLAQESLAGRIGILHMQGLSQHEIYGSGVEQPFRVDINSIKKRADQGKAADVHEIFRRIYEGSLPGIVSGRYTDWDVFYNSYIQTYIERDVSNEIPGVDSYRFRDFIRACACRIGQVLNVHNLAVDSDISENTAKRWLAELEKAEVIYFLHPYSNSALKRTIKAPKLYFFDMAAAACLTKYMTPETLENGALAGAILENYVINEIRKSYFNDAKECLLYYYRDKDAKEIDVILEDGGTIYPLEIKKSSNPGAEAASAFKVLKRGDAEKGTGGILCMKKELTAIDKDTFLIPIWML